MQLQLKALVVSLHTLLLLLLLLLLLYITIILSALSGPSSARQSI